MNLKKYKDFKLVNITHVLNNQHSITSHVIILSVHNSHSVYYPTYFDIVTNHHQRDQ